MALHFPDSRDRTLPSLWAFAEARRKPCVDALLMARIMDVLTVTLGHQEKSSARITETKDWNPHKDMKTVRLCTEDIEIVLTIPDFNFI